MNIFSTTTLDFETVKRLLQPFKSRCPDMIRSLCSTDPAVLEETQQELRKVLDLDLLKGHTASFATFIAIVSDLTDKCSWEDLRLQYTEKTSLYQGEQVARVCACGQNDCIYMGVFHGELGNLLLGSTCITKIGITTKKELAKQQRELKMRGICRGCKGKVDPQYTTCFKCKFPNKCSVCGKACSKQYTTCYTAIHAIKIVQFFKPCEGTTKRSIRFRFTKEAAVLIKRSRRRGRCKKSTTPPQSVSRTSLFLTIVLKLKFLRKLINTCV